MVTGTILQIPGGLGGMELAVILLIAVLLFGANKIPKLARSTGQAMGEFKRGREEIEQELSEIEDAATLENNGNEGSPSTSTSGEASSSTSETTQSESATTGESGSTDQSDRDEA